MEKRTLVLVEDNPAEAALARTALALHAADREVLEARDLGAAARMLERRGAPAALVIVGRRVFAGRPRRWQAYSAFVARFLAGWLPTPARRDSPPRPAPTS